MQIVAHTSFPMTVSNVPTYAYASVFEVKHFDQSGILPRLKKSPTDWLYRCRTPTCSTCAVAKYVYPSSVERQNAPK